MWSKLLLYDPLQVLLLLLLLGVHVIYTLLMMMSNCMLLLLLLLLLFKLLKAALHILQLQLLHPLQLCLRCLPLCVTCSCIHGHYQLQPQCPASLLYSCTNMDAIKLLLVLPKYQQQLRSVCC
jgi:hypothetical protein